MAANPLFPDPKNPDEWSNPDAMKNFFRNSFDGELEKYVPLVDEHNLTLSGLGKKKRILMKALDKPHLQKIKSALITKSKSFIQIYPNYVPTQREVTPPPPEVIDHVPQESNNDIPRLDVLEAFPVEVVPSFTTSFPVNLVQSILIQMGFGSALEMIGRDGDSSLVALLKSNEDAVSCRDRLNATKRFKCSLKYKTNLLPPRRMPLLQESHIPVRPWTELPSNKLLYKSAFEIVFSNGITRDRVLAVLNECQPGISNSVEIMLEPPAPAVVFCADGRTCDHLAKEINGKQENGGRFSTVRLGFEVTFLLNHGDESKQSEDALDEQILLEQLERFGRLLSLKQDRLQISAVYDKYSSCEILGARGDRAVRLSKHITLVIESTGLKQFFGIIPDDEEIPVEPSKASQQAQPNSEPITGLIDLNEDDDLVVSIPPMEALQEEPLNLPIPLEPTPPPAGPTAEELAAEAKRQADAEAERIRLEKEELERKERLRQQAEQEQKEKERVEREETLKREREQEQERERERAREREDQLKKEQEAKLKQEQDAREAYERQRLESERIERERLETERLNSEEKTRIEAWIELEKKRLTLSRRLEEMGIQLERDKAERVNRLRRSRKLPLKVVPDLPPPLDFSGLTVENLRGEPASKFEITNELTSQVEELQRKIDNPVSQYQNDMKQFYKRELSSGNVEEPGRFPKPATAAPRIVVQRKKTRLCRHFSAGHCRHGDKCLFAHGEEELDRGSAAGSGQKRRHLKMLHEASRYKTALCSFFEQGKCVRGDACAFAHGVDDLREPKGLSSSAVESLSDSHLPPPERTPDTSENEVPRRQNPEPGAAEGGESKEADTAPIEGRPAANSISRLREKLGDAIGRSFQPQAPKEPKKFQSEAPKESESVQRDKATFAGRRKKRRAKRLNVDSSE